MNTRYTRLQARPDLTYFIIEQAYRRRETERLVERVLLVPIRDLVGYLPTMPRVEEVESVSAGEDLGRVLNCMQHRAARSACSLDEHRCEGSP